MLKLPLTLGFSLVGLMVTHSPAAVFNVDFSDFDDMSDFDAGGLLFNDVFVGSSAVVDAQVIATSAYTPQAENNNGDVNGDLRINLRVNSSVDFTINFFQDGTNTPITPAYLGLGPGESFSYNLVVLDIDSNNSMTAIEGITSIDHDSLTLASNTRLLQPAMEQPPTGVFLMSDNSGEIPNPGTDTLTSDQLSVTAEFGFTDQASIDFSYEVTGTATSGGRNFLIDGETFSVPEPSSAILLGLASLTLGLRRRA